MLLRQCHKTLADFMELLNFAQDSLKRHEWHPMDLRRREWSIVSW